MLYESYARKIQKIANVKNFIVRFRIAIISCLCTLIALTVAYTSSKGTLPNGIMISPSVVYGEKLEYSAEAFLSEVVGYEFMDQANGVWVTEEPVNVGEYYIRAITEKVGGYRYSKPIPFAITPKTINLTLEDCTIEYGYYPDYDVEGLVYGDKLSGLEFKFDSLTEEKTLVDPVLDNVLIRNVTGDNVTGNYKILSEGAEVTFEKRDISVAPSYEGKAYDGKNIQYANRYTITSRKELGYEDTLEITTIIKNEAGEIVEEAIEPGTYTISVDTTKINGSDDFKNYNVTTEEITFVIAKRELTVSTKDITKTYDAKELKGNNPGDYFVSENSVDKLLEGHSLALLNDEAKSIINCGEEDNEYKVKVIDAEGNDLDKYYNISYDYGTLTVKAKDITITTPSMEFTYDGDSHSHTEGWVIDGLVESHIGSASGFISIVNVSEGLVKNTCAVSISDGTDDVTTNYNIIENFGTLTVAPALIDVTPLIADSTYDATVYDLNSASNFTVNSGQTYYDDELTIYVQYSINGETFETISDSGKYTIKGYDYEIVNGEKSNYKVTFEDGEFEIFQRHVEISLYNRVHKYSGEEYVYPSDLFDVLNGSFVYDGNPLVSVKFTDKDGQEARPIDVDDYTISYVTFGEDVLRNHDVKCNDTATLSIVQKDVYLKPYINENDIVVYNGQPYEYNNSSFTIVDNFAGEIYDHNTLPWDVEISNIEVKYYQNGYEVEPVNAGLYDVKIDKYAYSGKANYAFDTSQTVTLEIKEREVLIAPYITSTSKIYDGNYYSYDFTMFKVIKDNGVEVSDTFELLTKDSLELYVLYNGSHENPINAGTYDIYGASYSCSEITENNYDIKISSTEFVTFTINKFKINISPVIQDSYTYDGSAHPYDYRYVVTDEAGNDYGFELPYVNRATGIKDYIYNVEVKYNDSTEAPVNAGTYNVEITEWYSDEITKNNYDVTFNGAIDLIINKRKVAVAPYFTVTSVYYGEEYGYNSSEYRIIDMEDEDLSISDNSFQWDDSYIDNVVVTYAIKGTVFTGKPVNADEYLVSIAKYEYHGIENYVFVESPIEYYFEIKEREVIIAPYITDFEKVYDGLEYNYDATQYIVLYDNGLPVNDTHELLPGNSLELVVRYESAKYGSKNPLNVDTYYIYADGYICDDLTENNYKIIVAEEEFVVYNITPVQMSIKPKDQTAVYYNGDYQEFVDGFDIISGSFVGEEGIEVVTYISGDAVNAGVYDIGIEKIEFNDNTLSDNYSINYDSIVLFEIKARPLTLTLNGQEPVVYDGLAHSYLGGYTIKDEVDSLIYKDSLPFVNVLTGSKDEIIEVIFSYNGETSLPINADTYEVVATEWIATDITKNNYVISLEDAITEMKVDKRVVVIAPYISKNYFVYDNEKHLYDETEFKVIKDNGIDMQDTYNLYTYDNLTVTVRYECVDYPSDEEPINAGTYHAYITSYKVNDITKQNYDIRIQEEDYAIMIIDKRTVTVAPYLDSVTAQGKTYDGIKFEYNKALYEIVNNHGNDVSGVHELLPGNEFELSVRYESSLYGEDEPLNADTYKIFAQEANPNDLAKRNYNFEYADKYVEYKIVFVFIIIRPILSETKTYYTGNIAEYEVVGYEHLFNEFVGNDDVTFETIVPNNCVNVGKYEVSIIEESLKFINGAIPTNYFVNFAPAELEIIPRKILIRASGLKNIVYDGQTHAYDESFYYVTDLTDPENVKYYNNQLPCTNVLTGKVDMVSGFDVLYNGKTFLPLDAKEYAISFNKWYSDEITMSNYDVTFTVTEESVFEITKRNIAIAPYIALEAKEKVYDGKAYEYNPYLFVVIDLDDKVEANKRYIINAKESSVLAWGGNINGVTVKYYEDGKDALPINVGGYKVEISDWEYEGNDNYVITNSKEQEEINVTKRYVTLMPYLGNNTGKEYDGEEFVYDVNAFEIVKDDFKDVSGLYELIAGNEIELVVRYESAKNGTEIPLNADTYKIFAIGVVENELAERNYHFDYSDKYVEYVITPVSITIKPILSETKVYYTGNIVEYEVVEYVCVKGAFVKEDKVNPLESITIVPENCVNAGTYEVTFDPKDIVFEVGNSDNYIITCEAGTLVISPRPITISPVGMESVVYDGTEHKYNNEFYLVTDMTDPENIKTYNNQLPCTNVLTGKVDMVSGFDVLYNGKTFLPLDAKEYAISFSKWYSDEITMSNYDVTLTVTEESVFEITKRNIAIAPYIALEAKEKVYDGKAYEYNPYLFVVIDLDDKVEVNKRYIINAKESSVLAWGGNINGVTVKYYEAGKDALPINVGGYKVEISDWEYEGNDNYVITNSKEQEEINVTKRYVTLMPYLGNNTGKEYDGEEFVYDVNAFEIVKDDFKDVSGLYELIAGNEIELVVRYESAKNGTEIPLNADTYKIFSIGVVKNELAERNYHFDYSDKYVEYVITPVSITIKPILSETKVYYTGNIVEYKVVEYVCVKGAFVKEDKVNPLESITIVPENCVNAGTYEVTFNPKDIVFEVGNSDNYIITCEAGTLVISPRPITISPVGMESVVYDGTEHKYNNEFYLVTDITDPENIKTYNNQLPCTNVLTGKVDMVSGFDVLYNGKTFLPLDANEYAISFSKWYSDEITMSNYDVTLTVTEESVFEITKRNIAIAPYIALEAKEKVYDGKAYEYNPYLFVVIDLDDKVEANKRYIINAKESSLLAWGGNINGVTVKYYEDGKDALPINVGGYKVEISDWEYEGNDNYVITNSKEQEEINVTKRYVTLMPYLGNNTGKEYDGEEFVYDVNAFEIVKDDFKDVSGLYELIAGNEIELVVRYESAKNGTEIPLNADTYKIFAIGVVKNELAERNYHFDYSDKYVEYVITPVSITIKPILSETKVYYTGNIVEYEVVEYETVSGAFVGEESVKFETSIPENCVNAGTYKVTIIRESLEYINGAKSDNYEITLATGDLVISPRPITISPVGMESVVYDGAEHKYNNEFYLVTDITDPENIKTYNNQLPCTNILTGKVDMVSGFDVLYNGETSAVNAGKYSISFSKWYSDAITMSNYDVTFTVTEESVFEITKRNIAIAPFIDKNEKSYDGLIYNYVNTRYTIIDLDSLTLDRYNIDSTTDNNGALPWGGYINVVTVKFIRNGVETAPINAGAYEIEIIDWEYEGNDNYSISNNNEKEILTINRREIVINLLELPSEEYDGTEHKYPVEQYKIYDVITGNVIDNLLPCCSFGASDCETLHIEVSVNSPIFDTYPEVAGKAIYAGKYQFKIIGYNHEIDDNYSVSYDANGVGFEITPRAAKVVAKVTENFTYCGREVLWAAKTEYELERFVEGESVTVEFTTNKQPINAAKDYEVIPSIATYVNALEFNYTITYVNGKFEVNPAQIRFELAGATAVIYNGLTHEYNGTYSIIDAVTGDKLDKLYFNEYSQTQDAVTRLLTTYNESKDLPVNAGLYVVKAYGWLADSAQTLSNYQVVDYDDTDDFEILKRQIEITPVLGETTKVFDAIAFKYEKVNYKVYDLTADALEKEFQDELPCGGLINKFEVLFSKLVDKENNTYESVEEIVNVGTYSITFGDWTSLVKDNYEVKFNSVEYVITPREISIMPYIPGITNDNIVHTYNSEMYVYDSNNYTIIDIDGTLHKNDLPCRYDKTNTISDVVVEYYQLAEDGSYVPALPIDAGTYYVKVKSWVHKGIVENYNITPSEEMMEIVIDKLHVTITYDMGTLSNVLGPYIAKEYTLPNADKYKYVYEENKLLGNDEITVLATSDKALINAGTYDISINPENIKFVTGNSGNYDIEVIDAQVVIEKAKVVAELLDQTHIYDGLIYQYPTSDYKIISINEEASLNNKLLLGEDILVYVKYYVENSAVNPIKVGTYTISYDYVSALDPLVLNNYEFIFNGTKKLEISKCGITIAPIFKELLYGEMYEYNKYSYDMVSGTLGAGDVVSLNVYYVDSYTGQVYSGNTDINNLPIELQENAISGYPVNVGVYLTYISSVTIVSSEGEDSLGNYSIETKTNNYEIFTNDITIELVYQHETYNGLEISYDMDNFAVTDGILMPSDLVVLYVYYIRYNNDGSIDKVYTGNTKLSDIPAELHEYVISGCPIDADSYSVYISNIEIVTAKSTNYNIYWDKTVGTTFDIKARDVLYKVTIENEEELIYNFGQLTPVVSIDYRNDDILNQLVLDHFVVPTYIYKDANNNEITIADIVNAGTYIVEVSDFELINGDKSNYNFEFRKATFEVSPLEVVIELTSKEKEYDAKEFASFDITSVEPTDSTVPTVASKVKELTFNVTRVRGTMEDYETTTIVNVGVYEVAVDSWQFLNNENECSNFKVITKAGSTYTITPRQIYITLDNAITTYNGEVYVYEAYSYTGILAGQTLDPIFVFTNDEHQYSETQLRHAGEYTISVSGYVLYDENDEVIESQTNYNLNIINSNEIVTINKLEITIKSKNLNTYYMNEAVIYNEGFIEVDDIYVPDRSLFSFDVYYKDYNDSNVRIDNPINVGKYFILIDEESVSVNSPYEDYIIHVENDLSKVGILDIQKATISVTYRENRILYGMSNSIRYECDILSGFRVELIFKYFDSEGNEVTPKNVGKYTAEMVDYKLYLDNVLIEDKSNFDIVSINPAGAILTITQRTISIYGNEYKPVEYSGEAIVKDSKPYWHSSLPYGEEFTIDTFILLNGSLYEEEMIRAGLYVIDFDRESINFTIGDSNNYNFKYFTGSYEITPKKVQVEIVLPNESKVYDGISVNVTGQLVSGSFAAFYDTFDFVFKYDIKRMSQKYLKDGIVDQVSDAGTYTITLASYDVISSIGSTIEDYEITCTAATYTIYQREIKVVTPSLTVYYSGHEVSAKDGEDFRVKEGSELVPGHKFGWDQQDNYTKVEAHLTSDGKLNKVGSVILDENNNYVIDNYKILETEYGIIKVLKRPIKIVTGSATGIYGGSKYPFHCKEFIIVDDLDNLIEGVELPELNPERVTSCTSTGVTYVTEGAIANELKVIIKINNKGVTGNFDITYEYGTIQLEKRDLTIGLNAKYNNTELWYTGQPAKVSDYYTLSEKITTLGDEVNTNITLKYIRLTDALGNYLPEPIEESSLTNAGLYRIIIGDVVINKRYKTDDLTENYNITVDDTVKELYVTIKPLTIKVYTFDKAKIWDGEDLFRHDFDMYSLTGDGYGLLSNHQIRVDVNGNNAYIPAYDENHEAIRIMQIVNDLDYEIYDTNTGEVVTDNYIILEDKTAYLSVVEDFKLYCNEPAEYTGYKHKVPKMSGYCMTANNIRISNLTYEVEVTHGDMIDLGYYKLTPNLSTLKLYLNGEEVTEQFINHLIEGEQDLNYRIEPRIINIKPADLSVYYDGNAHSATDYEIIQGSLLDGHYAEITTTRSFLGTAKPYKYTDNMIKTVTIRDADGNDVSYLYNIDFNGSRYPNDKSYKNSFKAILEVKAIPFRHSSGNLDVIYDGKEHFTTEFSYDESAILTELGHHLVIIDYTRVTTYCKNKTNKVYFEIQDANGKSVNSYYNINGTDENEQPYAQLGKINVSKRVVEVTTHSAVFIYNGSAQSYNSYTITAPSANSGLLEGHTLVVIKTTSVTHVNVTKPAANKILEYDILDADGNSVKNCYTLDVIEGTITVDINPDLVG